MAKERQKARAAREAARRAEVQAAADKRAKRAKREVLLQCVKPTVPKRPRRYGALPTRVRAQLVVVFIAVQGIAWFLLTGVGARFSVAVLTAAVLLVLVKTRRSTTR